jgi:hypothetical protein
MHENVCFYTWFFTWESALTPGPIITGSFPKPLLHNGILIVKSNSEKEREGGGDN